MQQGRRKSAGAAVWHLKCAEIGCWLALQVKFIPEADLRVIDGLWRASSNGKFGYSVQKELWVQNRRYWERLFKVIDWTHGTHNYYR